MAEQGGSANGAGTGTVPMPSIEDLQHWTNVIGRAQQLMLEFALSPEMRDQTSALMAQWREPSSWTMNATIPTAPSAMMVDPTQWMSAATSFWQDSLAMWQSMVAGANAPASAGAPDRDRRFAAPEWRDQPLFAFIRQSYALVADRLLAATDTVDGLDPRAKAQLRFATSNMIDAMSPTNFAMTNPAVIKRTIETRGENLVRGLEHMLTDLRKGQLTHVDGSKFALGENIATTPGKVIHRTPLYELIQYTPTTERVTTTPVVIFPPWINRYYILDLNREKSFIAWCVDQGLSVFIVSWKSADASMKDVIWDDYVAAQIDAIATVRAALDVPSVHTIGYCVAGTTLAATLALLTARGMQDSVASATFFTAQVDFSEAGDLLMMVDDANLKLIEQLSAPGFLDGRYMAATFNTLRGRDLIWNYVVNNYLLGDDYPPFDLLYWNGDTTNLPATWHRGYLTELYRDNRLVQPGSMAIDGTPIDLSIVKTPTYIQAGREDHIAPARSVWKMMDHFSGPKRFVLAGSGHIAGVVNPPAANKYQHWINEAEDHDFDAFVAGAREVKGSWWNDWLDWLHALDDSSVKAKGGRIPGRGSLAAIEDAPGSYVKAR